MTTYFAHSLKDKPVEEWQPLEEHLKSSPKQRVILPHWSGNDKLTL